MPFHRFEGLEIERFNPHLSSGEGRTIEGKYMYFRIIHKKAGTGSELHYHPNELMIFPVKGKINAVVGKDRRIVCPGTFVHVPAYARHSVRATEEGGMDYLYIKDRTWSLIGIAADEAPPERAPTPQEIAEAHRGGRWPGGKKEPEKSRAIIDGLGECYYPILKSLEAPVASAHREHWVTGERLAFGFVEAPIGEVNHSEVAEHETFIYVLSGELDVRVAEEQKNVKAGDIVHIPKRTSSRIAPVKDAPVRYCVVKSTPWLEAAVDEHGAATDIR